MIYIINKTYCPGCVKKVVVFFLFWWCFPAFRLSGFPGLPADYYQDYNTGLLDYHGTSMDCQDCQDCQIAGLGLPGLPNWKNAVMR